MNDMFYDTVGDNMIIDVKNQRFEPIDLDMSDLYSDYTVVYKIRKRLINPFECMYRSIFSSTDCNDYFPFFAKCAKAVAKDCCYFPMFTFKFDRSNKLMCGNYQTKIIEEIYAELKALNKRKLKLHREGKSSIEIRELLKKDIDDFIKKVDYHLVPEDDLTIDEMLKIADKIENKQC